MAKLKIILLYFVLPILIFAAFVLYQVGAQHFGVAMMLAGAVVFLIWSWISTTPKQMDDALRDAEDRRRQADAYWSRLNSIREFEQRQHRR
ncbi:MULTISPECIES: hypothetical protein [Burkholderia]|uniref:Uncharacterized protein n=1 Tax=Burkholderia pseudomultivorans TaxID=1207504 RepID=A0ABU2EC41_9BURK|nr:MULTISPECIES: hypothetical protein [Burkholderia]MBR8428296.1 hypothetical protein [Burkholderia cenocepacia]MDN7669330.1 hypothetical protein [Burkholderia vietnamiensis]MDR8731172.1 hypothetical protein [Burkholderia pseudomultivorans]MDR8738739.1 hypothetical protein [Burkholderia pseudomultivorans]MDR8745348.1 hypothetical protein [Burkholderia pseudomultivorans]